MPTEDLSAITERLLESHSALSKADAEGALTTFRETQKLAKDRALEIARTLSIGDGETISSVAALTLALLQVASDTGSTSEAQELCRTSGAVAERLCGASMFPVDDKLLSEEHCQALFNSVMRDLQHRKDSLKQGEDVDATVDGWCPPLMVFFCTNLTLLKRLRDDPQAKPLIDELSPKSMLRGFLKQLIDETVLFVLVDAQKGSSVATFAQRVTLTGLSYNFQLAQTAVGEEFMSSYVQGIGSNIQMENWTAFYFDSDWDYWTDRHRIWHEGIPDDIAPWNGERVILLHACTGGGPLFHNESIFPYIHLNADPKGPPLDDVELENLAKQIKEADKDVVIKALKHQQKTGGNDESLQSCIDQLENTED